MAQNTNIVVLVGRLTKDPDLRHTPGGMAVASIRLAFTTRRKDGEEWVDKPNYVDVTVWGRQGESAATHLTKGRRIGVTGRLEWREWDANDGSKRQAIEVVADNIEYLDSSQDSGGGSGGDRSPHPAEDFQPGASADQDDIPF